MKNLFSRTGFVTSGLDTKQKKQSLTVTLSVILFFVLSAFTFMNFLYCFSHCIGSIVCGSVDIFLRDALRAVPIFLSFFMTLSGLMTAHTFYRNEDRDTLRRKAVKHAIIGIAVGTAIIFYVIVSRLSGRYLSLVEGSPSPFYPLDSVLYALLFIVLGIYMLMYLKRPDTLCYQGPSRAPVYKKCGIVRSFFRAFWLLFSLYGFCGFFFSFFIIDFTIGYIPYILAMMLESLITFLSIAVWELYYNNLTEEKRKSVILPLAVISTIVSVGSAIFYFIALKGNLDGAANVGFGILPVAFSSNVNIATMLVVAIPFIVSITALIKSIFVKIKRTQP